MPRMEMRGTAKPKNTARTIKRIFSYLAAYRMQLLFVLLAVIVSAGATVACDSLLKPAINDYIVPLYERACAGETIVLADFFPFLRLIGLMVVIFVSGALATWVNSRLMLHVSTRTLYRIRKDLFDELERLPMRYYDAHTHGELMSLFTNDTDTLRDMMSQSLPQLFSSLISVTAVFIMMVVTSPLLTLLVIATIALLMFVVAAVGKRSAGPSATSRPRSARSTDTSRSSSKASGSSRCSTTRRRSSASSRSGTTRSARRARGPTPTQTSSPPCPTTSGTYSTPSSP